MIGPRPRFGLDLGRASVKLVRCKGADLQAAERRVDPTLVGEARHAALREALGALASELGVRPRDELHVGVPRAQAIVKALSLPQAAPEELEPMVRLQAAKDLPFELADVVLTWGAVGSDEAGGQEVLYAAVQRAVLDELSSIVREAGLRPGCLEVSTQAAARTLALCGPAAAPTAWGPASEVLLVEVGHASSDVIVLRGGRLVYSRSASVGCGRDPHSEWRTRLSREVGRSLVAARTRPGESAPRTGPPDVFLLGGGGAGDAQLSAALAEQLGCAPQLLPGLHDPSDPARSARFVVARGLADPREAPGVPQLDLAHRAQAQAASSARRRRVVGALAGVLAFLGCLGLGQLALEQKAARVAELEAEREALAPAVARARALRDELKRVARWDRTKGRELEVLLAVSRALPDEDRAYLTQLRWSERRPLRLAGHAKDWNAVGEFLTLLERDPLVGKAAFDSIRRPRGEKQRGVEFSGQAQLLGGNR